MKPKMKTREICQYIPCGQTEACDSDCYIKRLEAENAALREKLEAAVEDMKRMDRYIANSADPCAALCEVC